MCLCENLIYTATVSNLVRAECTHCPNALQMVFKATVEATFITVIVQLGPILSTKNKGPVWTKAEH